MSKQLWSINAIASELDRDRRTVTAALADVPADGMVKGNKAWFLDSAVRALGRHGSSHTAEVATNHLLDDFAGRVVDFEEIRANRGNQAEPMDGVTFSSCGAIITFNLASTMFANGDADALLTWLKAGLPYWKEGDWDSGEGFEFVSHWILDFRSLLGREIRRSGDRRSARILRMTEALP